MKTILTAILVLLVVSVAFAGDTTVNFSSPTLVNGTKIAPGQYTVRYEIKGNTADVKIMQDQKTVATTTGTVVENKDKAPYDGVVRENKADGTSALKEIQFANKKQVIKIDDNSTAVGK
jgi:hypothetical protein